MEENSRIAGAYFQHSPPGSKNHAVFKLSLRSEKPCYRGHFKAKVAAIEIPPSEEKMPISYNINEDFSFIDEVWTGEISISDLEVYWRHYLADPAVLKIRRTIVDLRGSFILFKGEELDHLVRTIVVPRLKGLDWTTAIVVDNPVQYGVSRQYQVFAERYSKDAIFHDYQKAHAWLMAQ